MPNFYKYKQVTIHSVTSSSLFLEFLTRDRNQHAQKQTQNLAYIYSDFFLQIFALLLWNWKLIETQIFLEVSCKGPAEGTYQELDGRRMRGSVTGWRLLHSGSGSSQVLPLSIYSEEITCQLISWHLGTENCYFWQRQDPTSERWMGSCQAWSTDACFSVELFHPPSGSVAAPSYRTAKSGLLLLSFLFSLPCFVHDLLPLPAAVKLIFLLCFPSFSSQVFETCQHCTAPWHYPDQGDTNICFRVHGELMFFWLPVELVLGSTGRWLQNEFTALWDIYKEMSCNALVQWLIFLLDFLLSSHTALLFSFCICDSCMQK